MLRFIVLDVPLQNSSFHDTWLCQKKCIKVCWAAKLPLFGCFLPFFAVFLLYFAVGHLPPLNISSSRHQIKKLTKHKRSTINLAFQKSKNMLNSVIID